MCNYCGKTKIIEGWHDCPASLEAKAKIGFIVAKIYEKFGPITKGTE